MSEKLNPQNKFMFTIMSKSHSPSPNLFGKDFADPGDILPKTKTVRVVNMNIFYRMDFKACDPKVSCGGKLKFSGGREIEQVVSRTEIGFLREFPKTK